MSLRDDLNYGLSAFGLQIPAHVDLDALAGKLTDKPAQSTLTMVTAASVLFYLAERGRNEKVRDIYDAMVYCTTNISVGYCDIFARTPMGKLIGSALMTVGPAMAARTLDGPKQQPPAATQQATATAPAPEPSQAQILATLQQILAQLQQPPVSTPGASPQPDSPPPRAVDP